MECCLRTTAVFATQDMLLLVVRNVSLVPRVPIKVLQEIARVALAQLELIVLALGCQLALRVRQGQQVQRLEGQLLVEYVRLATIAQAKHLPAVHAHLEDIILPQE